jgi:hypothetical protein
MPDQVRHDESGTGMTILGIFTRPSKLSSENWNPSMYENHWSVKSKSEALNSFSVVLQGLWKFRMIQKHVIRLARFQFASEN